MKTYFEKFKRFGSLLISILAAAVAIAVVLFRRKQPSPLAPPSAPKLEDVPLPPVEEKPSEKYEAEKVEPASEPSAVIVRLNERHK